MEICIAEKFIK